MPMYWLRYWNELQVPSQQRVKKTPVHGHGAAAQGPRGAELGRMGSRGAAWPQYQFQPLAFARHTPSLVPGKLSPQPFCMFGFVL